MKILLTLAIAMAAGLALSRLMKLLNLPNVTGYLVAGILAGPFVLNLITTSDIENTKLITSTALGFIAFSIGGEFKLNFIKKLGGKIIVITVVQAVVTVLLVLLAMLFVPGEQRIPRALLLGAIAAATAPAATLLVVRQYRARGPVTDTLLPVTALDDAIGLMIFSLCFSLAQVFSTGAELTVTAVLLEPLREIGLSLLVGGAMGALLALVMRFFRSNANRLCLMLVAVFSCVALSELLSLSSLLTCMMLGAVFANMRTDSVRILELCEDWTPGLFMLFFVLSGAELNFSILTTVGVAGIVYILTRSIGKYSGAYLGSVLAHAEPNVRKYLGITLLPQAGVAIGMAQMVAASPELSAVSSQVVTVALFATLIYELAGPVLTKLSLSKAGEIPAGMSANLPLVQLFKRRSKAK
ncbi:MAG: cation:proton antiporter [Christensenellaceae bacterium]|nr:cation:proton antiporter [Christensenellaceae bacterium]